MQFYERLKELREDRDLTQREIAAILGTTQQQIYKYEKGEQEMTVSRLSSLCRFYGVSADYVLGLPEGLAWPRPGRKQGYRITSQD